MSEWLNDYTLRALGAGLAVAWMASPLGALVIWQRMAYFGDALAHASLLGIVISLFFSINLTLGILGVALLVAALLAMMQNHTWFSYDTLLGLLSHTALAFGLVCFSFLSTKVDLLSYLYGDILAVSWTDLSVIFGCMAFVVITLLFVWTPMLRIIIHPDLAQVEGIDVKKYRACFVVLLAFVVAMGIKVVGVLLMTAMLIMPAAAARCFAKSPVQVVGFATLISSIGVLTGLGISISYDIPTGPAIVVLLGLAFFLSLLSTFKKVN